MRPFAMRKTSGSRQLSLLGVNLVKKRDIGKVLFLGLGPATKGLFDGEQIDLGEPLGVFGLGLGRNRAIEVFA